jgi:hypothetical protein
MKFKLISLLLALCTHVSYAGLPEALAAKAAGDDKTAFTEYLKLAKGGDKLSMVEVGVAFHLGNGTKQDYGQAMDWYLKAIDKGDADALNNIGVLYRDGLGVKTNLPVAYDIFFMIIWRAVGSEDTQYRAGSNLEKTVARMGEANVKDALEFTQEYIKAYVEKRGILDKADEALKFTTNGHPIKALADLTPRGEPTKFYNLVYELKFAQPFVASPGSKIEYVTEQTIASTPLGSVIKKEPPGETIITGNDLISQVERQALVVKLKDEPAQVFVLKFPKPLKPAEWSKWVHSNYTSDHDATWAFMRGDTNGTQTVASHPCELRYKIQD